MRGGQPEKIVTEMVISAVVAIVFILFAPFPGRDCRKTEE